MLPPGYLFRSHPSFHAMVQPERNPNLVVTGTSIFSKQLQIPSRPQFSEMAIEEREQIGAAEGQIDLADFQPDDSSSKETPQMHSILDIGDKDPAFKSFTTPDRSVNRSTQMNTPQLANKHSQ